MAAPEASSSLDLGFVEVNDVDTVALHKDIRSHVGIPFSSEVAESEHQRPIILRMITFDINNWFNDCLLSLKNQLLSSSDRPEVSAIWILN
jgi:hypothetical protein